MPALVLFSPKFCIRSSLQHLTARWRALSSAAAQKNAAGLRFFFWGTASHNAFSSNSALDGAQCCSECLGAAQLSRISYLRCPEDKTPMCQV